MRHDFIHIASKIMKLIIVRHAQTDENLKGGDAARESNIPLNEIGVQQAVKLGSYLKSERIAAVYASPQIRAQDTARAIAAHHGIPVMAIDALNEQNLGEYATFTKDVLKAARKNSGQPFHLFKGQGGESYADVQARATHFVDSLKEKHPNDTVLVVSHGATLGALYLHLFGKEFTEENYKAHKPENTAYTIVELASSQTTTHAFNQLNHLES